VIGLLAAAAVGAAATPALAGGGVVGAPQPELAPFRLTTVAGNGSGAVLPDGNLVIATPSKSGTTAQVCVLVPGARRCASIVTLRAYRSGANQDTFNGTVEVVPTGGAALSVVVNDCCYIGANGGAAVFDSTDGGRTFGGEQQAGDIATIGAATFAGGSIVVGSYAQGGLQVQAISPHPTTPQQSYAVPVGGADGDTALATYQGGVLVASDDLTTTHVEFAKAGSALNTSSSYARVATFPHELVVAASGNAVLTDPGGSLTGGERLRFFNGTSFGPAYRVPDTTLGDDGDFAMQETGRTVHVFLVGRRDGYDVFEESTSDGRHWTALHRYAADVGATSLVPVLGPTGAGLLDETAGAPESEQPVLNAQVVHLRAASARVHLGHTDRLVGTAAPPLPGEAVVLQELLGGAWFPVRSTKELGTGAFTFTVGAATATYRAVVADKPGYVVYGYSNAATVVAVP
jgi:hypothetical protein